MKDKSHVWRGMPGDKVNGERKVGQVQTSITKQINRTVINWLRSTYVRGKKEHLVYLKTHRIFCFIVFSYFIFLLHANNY